MAERRMFAKTIALSDAFLDMPMSARCLYFTLGMVADDDGFVNSPRSVMRQCGASDDDMKILIAKKFVLIFDSGVIVIKHWRVNNYLRNDRKNETTYKEELAALSIDSNGAYHMTTTRLPRAYHMPQSGIPSIGKDSIGKCSVDQSRIVEGECEGETRAADTAEGVVQAIDGGLIDKKSGDDEVGRYADLILLRRASGISDASLYRIAELRGITREQIDARIAEGST